MTEENRDRIIRFVVQEKDESRTLEKYLLAVLNLSRKAVTKLKHHGAVLLNGDMVRMNETIRAGDVIELVYPPERISSYLEPQNVHLHIIYEDDDILVLDKQAGVCVHPTRGYPGNTLANGVLYYWQVKGEKAFFHLVNRLDKDTSGLVLVAKHNFAAQQLYRQQQAGELKRSYLGLVRGNLPSDSGTINLPIAREEGRTTRRKVAPHGAAAVTHYRVLKRFYGYTLLAVKLETGRTHQIRVHFSHLGYPLVGDTLYGDELNKGVITEGLPAGGLQLKRQFLHACSLKFNHPRTKEKIEFEIPLPRDLQEVIDRLWCREE